MTAILGTVVAVSVVAAVTVLGWHGTLDGETIASLFGVLVGVGGGAGAVALHSAAQSGNGGPPGQ